MGALTLDLREGFQGDQVVVRVDGRDVASEEDVTTDYSIGLARRISTTVGPRPAVVEVLCPTRNLAVSKEIDPREGPWLNVRLEGNKITLDQAQEEEMLR